MCGWTVHTFTESYTRVGSRVVFVSKVSNSLVFSLESLVEKSEVSYGHGLL